MVNERVRNEVLGGSLKNDRMISVRFQGKPFNITVIQVYAPISNAKEAEVERFYEELPLSSGHRTGKGQFSFKSQRKTMPNNAQTTAQLHSSHTLVK